MGAPEAPLCPGPDPNTRPARFVVPERATDCHVHVFGSRYPYQPNRSYTPPDASVDGLIGMHEILGISRAVVVQASVHGTDNRAVLDAVARHPTRLRGVAAVTEETSDGELDALHAGGVRGIRVNLVDKGGMPFTSLRSLERIGERLSDRGWHIEFLVHVELDGEFLRLIRRLPVPACVGHIGYTKTTAGLNHPGYRDFLALLRDGICWVKLTGPYRISSCEAWPYDDVKPFAAAVVDAAPDRVVWGSDWPHVMLHRKMPNDGELLDSLTDWVGDDQLRQRVLVDNPTRLYGFE